MKCPSCGCEDIKVVDSRPVEENNSIRRRRECLQCHGRFTTYEVIDAFQPVVVKKDGSKELFDKNKLLSGRNVAVEAETALDRLTYHLSLIARTTQQLYDRSHILIFVSETAQGCDIARGKHGFLIIHL